MRLLWALSLSACLVDVTYSNGPQQLACADGGTCPNGKVCVEGTCCASACEHQAESTCGQSGQCKADGTGCALYDTSIVCAAQTCAAGRITLAEYCNGQGSCQTNESTAC